MPSVGSSAPRPTFTAAALIRCSAAVVMTSIAGTSAMSRTASAVGSAVGSAGCPVGCWAGWSAGIAASASMLIPSQTDRPTT
nr:hypothetical protein [Angustibacter aerolatus]